MRILVVGSGGREHALAWKLASERTTTQIFAAPGNPGLGNIAHTVPIDVADIEGLCDLAQSAQIDLTVVGPELPLDKGIVDLFSSRALRIFGPSRAAARLESSKVFAKDFMARHGIPTARYRVGETALDAHALIASGELGFPVVVKADGLAAGKGVVVAPDRASANAAISAAMEERQFGDAGSRIVLEECLEGPEVSFFAICDGRRAIPLGSAQDYKRVFDDDQGPNTGGMGAFAPSPLIDAAMRVRIMERIVNPVLRGMEDEGQEYKGFLYAGLMLTCEGPKVIEFNVRFGDPEAQVVIPLVAGDLGPLLASAANGALDDASPLLIPHKLVAVVVASRDYPRSGPTGYEITGLDEAARLQDVMVFHAGTARNSSNQLVTAGGRVLTVVGRGNTYQDAIARAYEGVSRISFDGMQHRRDIGRKALSAAGVAGSSKPADYYG